MPKRSADTRAERLRRYWDKQAPKYDKQVAFFERVWFRGGRQWVCAQATGDVLEVAIGTGRNLPFYQSGIRLTGDRLHPGHAGGGSTPSRPAWPPCRPAPWRRPIPRAAGCCLRHGGLHPVAVHHLRRAASDRRDAAGAASGRAAVVVGPRGRHAAVAAGPPVAAGGRHPACHGEHQLRQPLLQVQAEGFQVERRERSKLGTVERLVARKPPADNGAPPTAGP
jgi:hypothetical protein